MMGFVLADQQGWLTPSSATPPFENIPLQTFAALRDGVNNSTADFFMWEHFTSKRYFDNKSIKRIGEIYTPWSSWKIVAADEKDERLAGMFEKIDQGIKYYEENKEEAVTYISTALDYSEEDARDWLRTVEFAHGVKGVKTEVIEKTVGVLKKAGVLDGKGAQPREMIGEGFAKS